MTRGDKWIRRFKPDPQAKLRLFCLPFAGGGTLAFRGWEKELPPGVELCVLCPPGRENRLGEAAFTEHRPLVAAAADAVRPWLDRPYAVLGHSMGSFVGFEMVRRLRNDGLPEPVHLYPCGHRGPHLPYPTEPMAELPHDEFIDELRRYNGTPEGVLESNELMELMLPLLRADFGLCEKYDHQPAPPLSCPITAYGGLKDPDVSKSDLEGWGEHSTGKSIVRLFPGDHFFIQQDRPEFLAVLSRELEQDLAALR